MSEGSLVTRPGEGGIACCRPAVRPPASVLAWSEARVDARDLPGPSIALWLPEGATVAIGIGQQPGVELETDAARRDGVGLVRRQSGGGAVLLYPGVMCWEAWMTKGELEMRGGAEGSGIRQSYAALCRPVVNGLARLGVEAFHAGICDISALPPGTDSPRKLAGTAQLRRRDIVLVHGSLLVSADIEMLGRYLKFPSAQPDYRKNRSHGDFCMNVSDLLPETQYGASLMPAICGAVVEAAQADGWETITPPASLDAHARRLLEEKYQSDKWNWEKIRPTAQSGECFGDEKA